MKPLNLFDRLNVLTDGLRAFFERGAMFCLASVDPRSGTLSGSEFSEDTGILHFEIRETEPDAAIIKIDLRVNLTAESVEILNWTGGQPGDESALFDALDDLTAYPAEPETWADVRAFAQAHRLDQDEYFHLSNEWQGAEPVWDDKTRWVAVFAVRGTNEGWYLHVDAVHASREVTSMRGRMVGKFWSLEAAQIAVAAITAYIYNPLPYARYVLIPGTDASQ